MLSYVAIAKSVEWLVRWPYCCGLSIELLVTKKYNLHFVHIIYFKLKCAIILPSNTTYLHSTSIAR